MSSTDEPSGGARQGQEAEERGRAGEGDGRARRARKVVRRIDPWSVFRVSVLLYIAVYCVVIVAGVILWTAFTASGLRGNVEKFIAGVIESGQFKFVAGELFRASVIIGAILVVMGTAANTLFAVLYNLISDLVGGVVVVVEDRPSRRAARAAAERAAASEGRPPKVAERRPPLVPAATSAPETAAATRSQPVSAGSPAGALGAESAFAKPVSPGAAGSSLSSLARPPGGAATAARTRGPDARTSEARPGKPVPSSSAAAEPAGPAHRPVEALVTPPTPPASSSRDRWTRPASTAGPEPEPVATAGPAPTPEPEPEPVLTAGPAPTPEPEPAPSPSSQETPEPAVSSFDRGPWPSTSTWPAAGPRPLQPLLAPDDVIPIVAPAPPSSSDPPERAAAQPSAPADDREAPAPAAPGAHAIDEARPGPAPSPDDEGPAAAPAGGEPVSGPQTPAEDPPAVSAVPEATEATETAAALPASGARSGDGFVPEFNGDGTRDQQVETDVPVEPDGCSGSDPDAEPDSRPAPAGLGGPPD